MFMRRFCWIHGTYEAKWGANRCPKCPKPRNLMVEEKPSIKSATMDKDEIKRGVAE